MGQKKGSPAGKGRGKPKKADLVPSSDLEIAAGCLLGDLRSLIEKARGQVAAAVNTELVMLNWRIGRRIRRDILGQERAEYGKRVVESVSEDLMAAYGRGFSRANLFRMVRFSEVFPDEEIVSTLSRQLGWSHFQEIVPLDDQVRRDFYATPCPLPSTAGGRGARGPH